MAEYDPPQPLWKRSLAGSLDLVLAVTASAIVTVQAFGTERCPPVLSAFLNIKCVSIPLTWHALLTFFGFIVGYFVVLGQAGGTIFQRLFRMRRPRAYGEMREVVKTLVSPDGKRRVQVYQRQDGRFAFVEEKRVRNRSGEPRWRAYPFFAAFCDSAEASEQQARAAIGWLGLMR